MKTIFTTFFFTPLFFFGQNFLNGDFEINTVSACTYNLSNSAFNSAVQNVFSFGGASPEADLHTDSCTPQYVIPQSGDWCIGITDNDSIALELSTSLTQNNLYELSFYAFGNTSFAPVADSLMIGLSDVNNSFGIKILTVLPVSNAWQLYTVQFSPLTNNIDYITIGLQSGGSWIQVDNFSITNVCINPTYGTDVQTACDSYTWIDGNTYTSNNNTATDTLINSIGCDSIVTLDLTINASSTGLDSVVAWCSYTWIDSVTYTASDSTATYTLVNAAGCDSVVTLNLSILSVSSGIFNSSPTLISSVSQFTGATYQWLDCDNNYAVISGATNPTFIASSNGNYAVAVTLNSCVDTSICENVNNVSVLENTNNILLFPNPTNNIITIDIEGYNGPTNVEIYDFTGKLLQTTKNTTISMLEYAKGIYVFKITYGDRVKKLKVIKD